MHRGDAHLAEQLHALCFGASDITYNSMFHDCLDEVTSITSDYFLDSSAACRNPTGSLRSLESFCKRSKSPACWQSWARSGQLRKAGSRSSKCCSNTSTASLGRFTRNSSRTNTSAE